MVPIQHELLLENENWHDPLRVYDKWIVHGIDIKDLSEKISVKNEVILNEEPKFKDANSFIKLKHKIKILSDQADAQSFRVETNKNSIFCIPEYVDKYWKVKVNGEEKKIIRCFGIYRGVALPQGEHIVEFTYEPMSLVYGRWVSLCAFLALCFLILYFLKTKPRTSEVFHEKGIKFE